MLLNLFLAILLKFISENDEDNDDVEGKGNEIKKQITSQEGEEKEPDGSDNDSIALNSSNSNLEEEFEQIKEYVAGDDIRTLNWKATAKRNQLMVNQYMDERASQCGKHV